MEHGLVSEPALRTELSDAGQEFSCGELAGSNLTLQALSQTDGQWASRQARYAIV
jgi:hypothetical protein